MDNFEDNIDNPLDINDLSEISFDEKIIKQMEIHEAEISALKKLLNELKRFDKNFNPNENNSLHNV